MPMTPEQERAAIASVEECGILLDDDSRKQIIAEVNLSLEDPSMRRMLVRLGIMEGNSDA